MVARLAENSGKEKGLNHRLINFDFCSKEKKLIKFVPSKYNDAHLHFQSKNK